MPEMINIRGQNFIQPRKIYDCSKCRACLKDCIVCNDGSNFKPYKTFAKKEGEICDAEIRSANRGTACEDK